MKAKDAAGWLVDYAGFMGDPVMEASREPIFKCVKDSCGAALVETLDIQTKHSAAFMSSTHCQNGRIGAEFKKTMTV